MLLLRLANRLRARRLRRELNECIYVHTLFHLPGKRIKTGTQICDFSRCEKPQMTAWQLCLLHRREKTQYREAGFSLQHL